MNMSRTFKDQIQQSCARHQDAPYWKYQWWSAHTAGRRGKRKLRPLQNRIQRAREKAALQRGLCEDDLVQDPPPPRRNIAWIYW